MSHTSGNRNTNKFLTIKATGAVKKFRIFQEMELFSPSQENFLYFSKQKRPKKLFIFLSKETCFYVSRRRSPNGFIYFNECIWINRSQKVFITSLIKTLREVLPFYHSHTMFLWYIVFLWLCSYITSLIEIFF